MEKKKIFVIFTYEIYIIGGTQAYTAGKAKYLKENGWGIQIFFYGSNQSVAQIPSLTEYIESGGNCYFLAKPPYKYSLQDQRQYLQYMVQKFSQRFNLTDFKDCEIIVESHYDIVGYWAELFSSIVGARHFFVCCNEFYRDELPNKHYEDNLDFFYFKWQRNEIAYNKPESILKLFNGYKGVTKTKYEMPTIVREQDAVQDVDFPIDKIQKLDWNICHIGRIVKGFVPYVIEGVAQLARRHPDKKINFIFVGNITPRKDFIIKTFNGINNVTITALGDMVPIPRILFSKIDVVCAMAGAASLTVHEGSYVITGNAITPEKTVGLLGYDTKDATDNIGKYTWCEALENVLVKHLYDDQKLDFPEIKPADWYYENFWTIVKNAAPTKEYYVERLSQERIRDWTATFPFGSVARGARIILFGATEIAKDYKKQIQSQSNSQIEFGNGYVKQFAPVPYCTIVATVDEHPENFDNAVVGVERLLQKDYDAILITTFPQQAQAAYNRIVQIVPDMAGKIIYNFQAIST